MNDAPPAEVWFVRYRWINAEATGFGDRFFATRAETEEFLHHCYVSQFSAGEVLAPTLITTLDDIGEWVPYTFAVETLLAEKSDEALQNGTTRERTFADLPPTVQQSEPAPPLNEGT